VAEIKTGYRSGALGYGFKDLSLPIAYCSLPITLYFLWFSFRSQLRGSGGFIPPSLPGLLYVEKFLASSFKKSCQPSAFSKKFLCLSLIADCFLYLYTLKKDCQSKIR
jgi:hypothetical protein